MREATPLSEAVGRLEVECRLHRENVAIMRQGEAQFIFDIECVLAALDAAELRQAEQERDEARRDVQELARYLLGALDFDSIRRDMGQRLSPEFRKEARTYHDAALARIRDHA